MGKESPITQSATLTGSEESRSTGIAVASKATTTSLPRPGAQHCAPGAQTTLNSSSSPSRLQEGKRNILAGRRISRQHRNSSSHPTSPRHYVVTPQSKPPPTEIVINGPSTSDASDDHVLPAKQEELEYPTRNLEPFSKEFGYSAKVESLYGASIENDGLFKMKSEYSSRSVKSFEGLSAELVDPVEERMRVEQELLKAIQDDAVVAELVEAIPRKKKRCRKCAIVAVVTVIIAVLTIVFASRSNGVSTAPTMQPTLPPEERTIQLVQFLNDISTSKNTIVYPYTNTSTVESKSLAWMIDEDPLRLTLEDSDRFLQRFVLVCLFMGSPENELGDDWLREESECSWSGVDCDDSGIVIGLALSEKSLKKLPSDLGLLNHVRSIELDSNSLTGTIPSSLSLMTDLSVFEMQRNSLSGTVPWDTFSTMGNLEIFDIGKNSLSGSLPSLMGRWWPNLTIFSVWSNSISGGIPSDVGAWSLLREFHVDTNLISGSLPPSVGAWTNLHVFYGGETLIGGTLPSEIAAWTNLDTFTITRCNMIGTLPAGIADQWLHIGLVDFSVNSFSGTIPAGIDQWSKFEMAWFENNQFTGTMPLCGVENPQWKELTSDCEALNCTCCTLCCPGAWNDIPMYQGCLSELK